MWQIWTQKQSIAKRHRPSSYPIDHHQQKQSTMCMNCRLCLKEFDISTHAQAFQQDEHGWRQSRRDFFHHGGVSQQKQCNNISPSLRIYREAIWEKSHQDCNQQRWKCLWKGIQPTTMRAIAKMRMGTQRKNEVRPRKKYKDIFVADLIIPESHRTHLYIHEFRKTGWRTDHRYKLSAQAAKIQLGS